MSVDRELFGKMPDGEEVELFTLTNRNGLRAKIMTYGATLTSVEVPDRDGRLTNVTLALDSLADYLKGHPCLGSTIGRYANRIALGRFELDGVEYRLATNNGPNHLHGGIRGFDKVVWKAHTFVGTAGVIFSYESGDGEEGYPGRLSAQVTYDLTDHDELLIAYDATCDKPTVVNLTNHAYWNLGGAGAGDVLGHRLTLAADAYLPADAGLIPTGEIRPVQGTPLDFTQPRTIGSRIQQTGFGYDHCFVLRKPPGQPENAAPLAARVEEPHSGRVMEVATSQPGVQLYTANFLDGRLHGGGVAFGRHFGLCLEAQHYPDSPNRRAFPSTVLRPGETYKQVTMHKFDVQ